MSLLLSLPLTRQWAWKRASFTPKSIYFCLRCSCLKKIKRAGGDRREESKGCSPTNPFYSGHTSDMKHQVPNHHNKGSLINVFVFPVCIKITYVSRQSRFNCVPTLYDLMDFVACQAPLSMGFSRQEYWSSCHSLLQGSYQPRDQTQVFCFLHWQVGSLSLVPPGKPPDYVYSILNNSTWNFMVHVLLKPGLENFEHYFTSVWDECNHAVVWAFFDIAFLWDWKENWPFPVLWPRWVCQICWHIECSTSQHYLLGFEIAQLEFHHLHWLCS